MPLIRITRGIPHYKITMERGAVVSLYPLGVFEIPQAGLRITKVASYDLPV